MLQKQQRKFQVLMTKGVITDHQVQNWFSKFHSDNTSWRNEPRPGRSSDLDQDTLRELVECNQCKST